MRVDILTLFPEMFAGPFATSILSRAQTKGLLEIHLRDYRRFGLGRHRTVDDTPYGGGGGCCSVRNRFCRGRGSCRAWRAQTSGGPLDPAGRDPDPAIAAELTRKST